MTMNSRRTVAFVGLALLTLSATARAEDDPSSEIAEIRNQLADRLSPTEAAMLQRIDALEDRIDSDSPWSDPRVIIAISVAIAGWGIALFQFFGNRRQRIWELLLESLRWFEGGTQQRSIGIALVETKWQYHPEFQSRWTSILINQAIYLLTRLKSRDAIHERANLYRIMNLLIETVDPSGCIDDFERKLLKETLEQYDENSDRGLVNLDAARFNKWKGHFGAETTESE